MEMPATDPIQTTDSPPRSRPRQRIHTACLRCRQRKSRCDSAIPTCTLCAKARVSCVYDEVWARTRRSLAEPETPIRTVGDAKLKKRIKRLETLLRQAAPHVELPPEPTSPLEAEAEASPGASGASNGLIEADSGGSDAAAPPTTYHDSTVDSFARDTLSHQVGLVSLSAGADPRYIGPSSGFFLTKLLSSGPTKSSKGRINDVGPSEPSRRREERELAIGIFQDATPSLPPEHAIQQLSKTYFETIHLQFPFLHEPTHRILIEHVCQPRPAKTSLFQVLMVLSISAMIVSRRSHVEIPAVGWCAAAMKHFPDIQIEGSVQGLQCLLLMLVYAMHSPSSKFSAWHINYQCIAMVLDLGLQRACAKSSTSQFEREMKTRIFWVVYSLDRKLGTMMGRPIGLRDEACDLRLPANTSDEALKSSGPDGPCQVTHMDFAIHFFKLAKLTSEIKYVLHSVQRDTPRYAYPAIVDINEWQDSVAACLDEWRDCSPHTTDPQLQYGSSLCRIQYFTTKMLLLLPTPGIPRPRSHCLLLCYDISVDAIRLFHTLYSEDLLVYSWATCHAVILHAFCMLYCATKAPQLVTSVSAKSLSTNLRAASNVLSAIGEHWTGAKRTRDLLDTLANSVLEAGPQNITLGAGTHSDVVGVPSSISLAPGNSHADAMDTQGLSMDHLFTGFDVTEGANHAGAHVDFGNLFIETMDFPVSGNGLFDFGNEFHMAL